MLWAPKLAWDIVSALAGAAADRLFGENDLRDYESRTSR